MNKMRLAKYVTALSFLLTFASNAHGASQLASYYESLLKHRATGGVSPSFDPFKVVPSEEIPVILDALNSGNPILIMAAVNDATLILQVHKTDGENPNFLLLHPPLPEVMREFQVVVPALIAHFDDGVQPRVGSNGTGDSYEIVWKEHVVEFFDVIGAAPPPEILAWMLKVVQWPNGGDLPPNSAHRMIQGVQAT